MIRPWEHKTLATEKQIAANRANAKRSTGPKTAAGKQKSSRNAYRHGLSGPAPRNAAILVKIESAVRDCVGEAAAEDKLTSAAADFFGAHIAVLRIRAMRTGSEAMCAEVVAVAPLVEGRLTGIGRVGRGESD